MTVLTSLANIAAELSSVVEWEVRLRNVLSLSAEIFPQCSISLGIQAGKWRTFFSHRSRFSRGSDKIMLSQFALLSGDERVGQGEYRARFVRHSANILSLPVVSEDRVLGILQIICDPEASFSVDHVRLASVIAAQIGSFVRNMQACLQEIETREQIEEFLEKEEQRVKIAEEDKNLLACALEQLSDGVVVVRPSPPGAKMRNMRPASTWRVSSGKAADMTMMDFASKFPMYHLDGVTMAEPDELPPFRALEFGEVVDGEEWIARFSDGREAVLSVSTVPVCDHRGRVSAAVVVWQEMSGRSVSEDSGNFKRACNGVDRCFMHSLMEFAPVGIHIADANDSYILMSSRYGMEMLGRPMKSAERVSLESLADEWDMFKADGETKPDFHELPIVRATLAGEVVMNEEWRIQRPDGTRIPVLVNAGPILDRNGDITGGISVFRDIHRIRETHEAMSRHLHLLQRALVPSAPEIGNGYGLASAYIPAFGGEEIGGDFYDVFDTEDGKVGILIGDVSGKGTIAAALAASARSTVRAFAYDLSAAGEALSHANAVLCKGDMELGSFITVVLAILDPETGDLRYSCAGHPPPAVRRADGTVEFLTYGQPPLGLSHQYVYNEATASLGTRDKILLYTDGISESRRESEMFGLEGIERVLRNCGHSSVQDVLGEVLAAAGEWSQGRLDDDTAVIVIERHVSPAEVALGKKVKAARISLNLERH
ncbi:MAG TPA: SpoIIE family protein phosphatase [Armatimonadota bacterium]|jgi:PAS domain-containing protein